METLFVLGLCVICIGAFEVFHYFSLRQLRCMLVEEHTRRMTEHRDANSERLRLQDKLLTGYDTERAEQLALQREKLQLQVSMAQKQHEQGSEFDMDGVIQALNTMRNQQRE